MLAAYDWGLMDFDLSPDQVALQSAARQLLAAECARERVRAAAQNRGFDTGLWASMVAQGWTAIAVPEGLGGLGLGAVEIAVLLEQVGAHLAPVPLTQQLLALAVLADSPWGGKLISGEVIAAAARAPLNRNADGSVSGRPEPVIYGARADLLIAPCADELVAIEPGGDVRGAVEPVSELGEAVGSVAVEPVSELGEAVGSVAVEPVSELGEAVGSVAVEPVSELGEAVGSVAVEPVAELGEAVGSVAVEPGADELVVVDLSGIERTPEPAMDQTRELAWITLDHAPAQTVGGAAVVAAHLDRGAVYHSAEMLGGAEAVMNLAVDYAKNRRQFGRPIGSFQAVKHRCADMLVDVEGMRSAVYHAAWAIGAQHPDASVAAATAKIWCSDAAVRVAESALQVHGGIGFTWDVDVHLYLKRAQLDQTAFGDARHHRARLAAMLTQRLESGGSVLT